MTTSVLNPDQRQELKNAVEQIVASHYRKQAELDNISEICKRMKEKEIIDPKMLRKLATTIYKDQVKKLDQETTEILDLAEEIGVYSHEAVE